MPTYRVSKQLWFCAAHQVRLSETRCESLHGHNYRVVVHAEAAELDATSYVLDFAALKSAAVQATGRFDHHNINEVEPFIEGGRNPTAEELAQKEGEPADGGLLIRERPTQQEIAGLIGTSRETVSRALNDFTRRGLLEMQGKQILVRWDFLRKVDDAA